ncbi:MAG: methyltransferase domain-containing protein [Bdellovibrionota bacterium]
MSKTLQRELNYIGAIARDQKVFDRLQRNHDLLFIGQAKDETAFEKSRVAEMVLKCPAYGRYKISKRQLQVMADAVKELGPRRLVVSIAGRHFNRQDLSRYLVRELEERGAVMEDGIEDEVWMFCIDQDWYFGLPVKKARDADGREAREEERRGSLPPPVAAAIAFASMVRNDDIVLDPTCGSGTLLAEAHAFAPSAHLIGFDIDPSAAKIAKANLKHVIESDIRAGDVRQAKLENANVTLTLANLPFGKQFGSKTTNAELYTDLIRKSLEFRDPDRPWRGVFLTSDDEAFAKAARANPSVAVETLFKVKIRGELASVYRVSTKG